MKTKLLLLLLLFTARTGLAQDVDTTMVEQYVEKEFVILLSSKNYESALKTAREAAVKLKVKLDLRGLKKHKETGLTWGQKTCEDDWFSYPCYVARGRYDDGQYISIEYSSAYSGFREGYYIVVAAGGSPGDVLVKQTLAKTRKMYRDAYRKRSKVYIGCMH
jgi:hypothetical protein